LEASVGQRQRVIILVGADQCGKTEIGKALSADLGVPYWKFEREWDQFRGDPAFFARTVRYGDEYFASYLAATGASVVKDRGYPCEWVYSAALRRPSDREAIERADQRYSELGAVVVWCRRSSYAGISDDLFPGALGPEKLEEIDRLYGTFCGWTRCRVIRLNVDDANLDRELEEIRIGLGLLGA
jgi:hypothetical protein